MNILDKSKIPFKEFNFKKHGVTDRRKQKNMENMQIEKLKICFASDYHRAAAGYTKTAPERAERGQGNAIHHKHISYIIILL